jgi:hypothetical protein
MVIGDDEQKSGDSPSRRSGMGLEHPGEMTGSQNEQAAKQRNNRDSSRPTLFPRPDEPC